MSLIADWRGRLAAILAVVIAGAGLAVGSGTPAVAAVTQRASTSKPNNYAGPNCPDPRPSSAWNCTRETTGVTQINSGLGENRFESTGATGGSVTQTNTTKPNKATCTARDFSAGVNVNQKCTITQNGNGGNDITIQIQAFNLINEVCPAGQTCSVGGRFTVTQNARQEATTKQTSSTGRNGLIARILLSQEINAENQVDPENGVWGVRTVQNYDQIANITQKASNNGNNSADLSLLPNQTSRARGTVNPLSPTDPAVIQEQNRASGRDGEVAVNQSTCPTSDECGGTNFMKVRGADTKLERSQAIPGRAVRGDIGTARQLQGHTGGGWNSTLTSANTGNRASNASVVDVGRPGSNAGLTNTWQIETFDALGLPVAGGACPPCAREQIDNSVQALVEGVPSNVTSNQRTTLIAPALTVQTAYLSALGAAFPLWTGELMATLQSDTTLTRTVEWAEVNVDHELRCNQNNPRSTPANSLESAGPNPHCTNT